MISERIHELEKDLEQKKAALLTSQTRLIEMLKHRSHPVQLLNNPRVLMGIGAALLPLWAAFTKGKKQVFEKSRRSWLWKVAGVLTPFLMRRAMPVATALAKFVVDAFLGKRKD